MTSQAVTKDLCSAVADTNRVAEVTRSTQDRAGESSRKDGPWVDLSWTLLPQQETERSSRNCSHILSRDQMANSGPQQATSENDYTISEQGFLCLSTIDWIIHFFKH